MYNFIIQKNNLYVILVFILVYVSITENYDKNNKSNICEQYFNNLNLNFNTRLKLIFNKIFI